MNCSRGIELIEGDTWNSLEIAKLLVGISTPIVVAGFGWFISNRLKRIDFNQWSNQKIIEKRLIIYDEIAPKLNTLLCFYTWVGDWKENSPSDIVNLKRELDKTINVYRHLFKNDVFESYQSFIHTLFEPYTGAGHDAKIKSVVKGVAGDRSQHSTYKWNNDWERMFSNKPLPSTKEIREHYYKLMNSLRDSLGIIDKTA